MCNAGDVVSMSNRILLAERHSRVRSAGGLQLGEQVFGLVQILHQLGQI